MELAAKSHYSHSIRMTRKILIHYVRQAYGVLLVFFAIFLFISFLTYDRSDPSWNTIVDGPVQNLGGHWGAICADIIVQFFGKASLFAIFALFINGLFAFFQKAHRSLMRGLLFTPWAQWAVSCLATYFFPAKALSGGATGIISLHYLFFLLEKWRLSLPPTGISTLLLAVTVLLAINALNLTREDARTFLRFLYLGTFGSWHYLHRIFKGSYDLSTIFYRMVKTFSTLLKNKKEQKSTETEEEPYEEKETSETQEMEPSLFSFTPDEKANDISSPSSISTLKVITPKSRERGSKSESVQPELNLECTYQLPALGLLTPPSKENAEPSISEAILLENAKSLMTVLEDFGIRGEITKAHPGPVVTLYELVPAPGIKASRVIGLADDIARSMSALSTRIAVIPGHNAIGIELPNKMRQTVYLRELLTSRDYEASGPKLPLALGKDIGGDPVIADLARMPHLLVAGTTGAGKSVAINTMILSLLYRLSPDHCRFIMIDPKMLELSVYNGIPHLLSPVVTDPKKAVFALKWTVKEMEDRYRAMSKLGVRNIEGYNARLAQALANGEELTRQVQTGFDNETGRPVFETQPLDITPLPYIVVVVDEMADLMLVAGKDIEATVQRLAQMARAAGIHLIMATQRPSVDVITGTIKANFPTRISFQVTSRFDSRTILGEQGAEQLLGRGDMLYMEGGGKIQRVHGPFVSDGEVERVVHFLKAQAEPDYIDTITEEDTDVSIGSFGNEEDKGDALYQQALQLVRRERKASTSFIQRHLRVGYNTAARIIEQMETEGIVSQANHVGKREVLISTT
ncbi:MAG: DNA translocase FtsK 4TM domain-containing protein [Caedimonas sp.]|nr:DNA translocase FtsK 4TM domain-containing protein [Caedimonas sp.]